MQSQQNKQIYSELFSDNDENLHSKKIEYDFDLPKVIKNAVNIIKEKSNPYSSLFQTKKSNIKNPCGICQKSVNKNQHAIYCTICLRWIHRKCNGTSLKEYEYLTEEDDDIPWQCILCDIDEMAFKFPFSHLSKIELNDLYGLDFPFQLQLLPNYELRSKLSHIPTLDNFDLDENYVQSINSNYFDILDLQKLNDTVSRKHFSLFHVNTRSLSKHFDQLLTVLSSSKINFDVIGISETKQKTGMGFLVNVDINNYFMYTQPSKLASGGVAIYVNDKLGHPRVEDVYCY